MQDQRKSSRQRALKAGRIVFNNGAVIDCILRNVTRLGACLLVESPIGVPDQFELVISANNTRRRCHVAWRSDDQIGVAFSDADAV